MKYINQLEHRDIPYEHNLDHGAVCGGKQERSGYPDPSSCRFYG